MSETVEMAYNTVNHYKKIDDDLKINCNIILERAKTGEVRVVNNSKYVVYGQ